MPIKSPQDIYARHLLSPRGYPLWTPEPSRQFLAHRRDGLWIGDVGVIIPEDGCFDVFFNLCLPRDHPLHRATGVPDGFEPILLSDTDIRTVVDAENPGRILATSSVKTVGTIQQPSSSGTQSSILEYQFNLSSSEGALLILPEGAERHDLRNHHLFLEAATRHGINWYRFAEEKIGHIVGNDSLYLITGLYKTRSWSLAAFDKTAGNAEYTAQLRLSQLGAGGDSTPVICTWDTTRAIDWRVGPTNNHGIPNQSVFIRGFKVAHRTGLFGSRWITVKADVPSTRPNLVQSTSMVPGESWLSYVFSGLSTGTIGDPSSSAMRDEVASNPMLEAARDEIENNGALAVSNDIAVYRMQEASQAFHPSDIINRYLLNKESSATIAITHDDEWISLLERGLLQPEDIEESLLETLVSQNYHVVLDAGAVYLQSRNNVPATLMATEVDTAIGEQECGEESSDIVKKGAITSAEQGVMDARQHDYGASSHTVALSFNPASTVDALVQQSKAHVSCFMWEEALRDANRVIELDPSSPLGYQRKLVALHGAGRDKDAATVFETILEKMSESSDPVFQCNSRKCIRPEEIKETIRDMVQRIICKTPRVLINTKSGRLLDKFAQEISFESQPIFYELISSITTDIDHTTIEREVTQYYRYVMFSHKWEDNEPLYDRVLDTVVYDLEDSKTHRKLKAFCKVVRDDGFNWAWSDTCCIDKRDYFVLEEALVSMFKWYQGAAMTIVFLLGVHRSSEMGSLERSVWNTRAWTLQEYLASKVVRFYTEDWTPYLNLAVRNHKDSPEVISEMENATAVSTQMLMSLRPGLNGIRKKLRLVAPRRTTMIEDEAYSLLGIFSIPWLSITYGEGDKALGRLLAQILTRSGDTSILAWSGRSGSFNSCLPGSIAVFKEPEASYIPAATTDMAADFRDAIDLGNMTSITGLYDRLNRLPVPLFMGQCMRLPCVSFKLGRTLEIRNGPKRMFRAQTSALGVVEIETGEDLSRMGTLYLVHPWIEFLLDLHPADDETIVEEEMTNTDDSSEGELLSPDGSSEGQSSFPSFSNTTSRTRQSRATRNFGLPFTDDSSEDESPLCPSSSNTTSRTRESRALGFISRLRQPFGALLLTRTHSDSEEYRRVASDSLITVQVEEITSEIMDNLTRNVRVLDVR